MKKIVGLAVIFGFLIVGGMAYAHEPSAINITYDAKAKILHISVQHVTHYERIHYIRQLRVRKNDEEPLVFYLSHQTSHLGFDKDIPMEAKPGDRIWVKAICSEAGYREVTYEIPAEEKAETESKGE